jgi:hypothetical protein
LGDPYFRIIPAFNDDQAMNELDIRLEGKAPAGLDVVEDGNGWYAIGGIPDEYGPFVFEIAATDAQGETARMVVELEVRGPQAPPLASRPPSQLSAVNDDERIRQLIARFNDPTEQRSGCQLAAAIDQTLVGYGTSQEPFRQLFEQLTSAGFSGTQDYHLVEAAQCSWIELVRERASLDTPLRLMTVTQRGQLRLGDGGAVIIWNQFSVALPLNPSAHAIPVLVTAGGDGQCPPIDDRTDAGGFATVDFRLLPEAADYDVDHLLILFAAPRQADITPGPCDANTVAQAIAASGTAVSLASIRFEDYQ